MKNLLFTLLILLATLQTTQAAMIISEQPNQREVIFVWQNEQLTINGKHRPYSTVKIFENEQEIAKTQADSRGAFTFNLGKTLNPETEHQITIKAFDQFEREIKNAKGEPDIITKTILPGLTSSGTLKSDDGTPIAGARIDLIDQNDNLLNSFYSDENGNFLIVNAPKNAELKITAQGFLNQKIDFNGQKTLNIVPQIDPDNPPQKVNKTDFTYEPEQNNQIINKGDTGFTWSWLIWLFGITTLSAGGYLFYKKNKAN